MTKRGPYKLQDVTMHVNICRSEPLLLALRPDTNKKFDFGSQQLSVLSHNANKKYIQQEYFHRHTLTKKKKKHRQKLDKDKQCGLDLLH